MDGNRITKFTVTVHLANFGTFFFIIKIMIFFLKKTLIVVKKKCFCEIYGYKKNVFTEKYIFHLRYKLIKLL